MGTVGEREAVREAKGMGVKEKEGREKEEEVRGERAREAGGQEVAVRGLGGTESAERARVVACQGEWAGREREEGGQEVGAKGLGGMDLVGTEKAVGSQGGRGVKAKEEAGRKVPMAVTAMMGGPAALVAGSGGNRLLVPPGWRPV